MQGLGQLRSSRSPDRLMSILNVRWHRTALIAFLFLNIAHILEHVFQAAQIFLLNWPRPLAGGMLGLIYPWLVTSEWLHYFYAIAVLAGLIILRPGISGRARLFWNVALVIQFWHHFEHALLLGQALVHQNLFGLAAPTSILQLFLPRVELHLFYNMAVLYPFLIALALHFFPSPRDYTLMTCGCVLKRATEAREISRMAKTLPQQTLKGNGDRRVNEID